MDMEKIVKQYIEIEEKLLENLKNPYTEESVKTIVQLSHKLGLIEGYTDVFNINLEEKANEYRKKEGVAI